MSPAFSGFALEQGFTPSPPLSPSPCSGHWGHETHWASVLLSESTWSSVSRLLSTEGYPWLPVAAQRWEINPAWCLQEGFLEVVSLQRFLEINCSLLDGQVPGISGNRGEGIPSCVTLRDPRGRGSGQRFLWEVHWALNPWFRKEILCSRQWRTMPGLVQWMEPIHPAWEAPWQPVERDESGTGDEPGGP